MELVFYFILISLTEANVAIIQITLLASVINHILLLVWFGLLIFKLKDYTGTDTSLSPVVSSSNVNAITSSTPSQHRVAITNLEPQGLKRNIPFPLFWCPKCEKQKTDIKIKNYNEEELSQKWTCTECNSTLKVFWNEPNKNEYTRLILGTSLFIGGMVTTIVSISFFLGVTRLVLAIVCLIVGLAINWKQLPGKMKVERVPDYATERLPLDPLKWRVRELVIFGVSSGIGGLAIFGLILIIF